MERYMLPLRILLTLLILTMLLPGWGLLSASNVDQEQPAISEDANNYLLPFEH